MGIVVETARGTVTSTATDDLPSVTARTDPAGRPLVPTPTEDVYNPLNWPIPQKYICIALMSYSYFTLTYFSAAPIPSFAYLQEQLNINYSQVSWSFALPCLGLSLGTLLFGALADTYGRRSIMILGTVIARIASGCTSIKTINFEGYMAARLFQGIGAAPAGNVGLVIINDVSWEHERGFRIGLWAVAANCGLILGGTFGGLLADSGEWIAYHVAILFAVQLVLQFLLLPETLYPRAVMVLEESRLKINGREKPTSSKVTLPRTKQLGYFHLGKVPAVPHPKPWLSITQFITLFKYPTVSVSSIGYCFLQYEWLCSILTLVPDAYADKSPRIQGVMLLGLLVGLLAAEVFCSGHLSDRIMVYLTRRNGGKRLPEMRLLLAIPGAILTSLGLVLWGLSIDKQWHWMVAQVALFLVALGLQTGNTVVVAYLVDNYPDYTNEVLTFWAVIINLCAFTNPWFDFYWVEASGYTWTFAAECMICAFGLILIYLILYRYGPRFRNARPMYLKRVDGVEVENFFRHEVEAASRDVESGLGENVVKTKP